jgi:hypothetical protein
LGGPFATVPFKKHANWKLKYEEFKIDRRVCLETQTIPVDVCPEDGQLMTKTCR